MAKKKDDPKSFEYELVCRVNLLQLLASQSDAAAHLAALAKGDDEVAALARLEIARKKITTESTEKGKKETPASASSVPSQGDKSVVNPLEKAALDAAGLGHPVVLDYILTCAREDAKARGKEADCYAPALLMMIAAVPEDITDMKIEHYRAALAATCLADIGGDAALAGLKKCLDGKYTAGVRVTAVGLLKSDNPAIADLARPFLKSPYDELAVDAGLILGRFGDRDAKAVLTDIAAKPDKHAIVLLARANWYLLKIAGKSKEAARELAKEIK